MDRSHVGVGGCEWCGVVAEWSLSEGSAAEAARTQVVNESGTTANERMALPLPLLPLAPAALSRRSGRLLLGELSRDCLLVGQCSTRQQGPSSTITSCPRSAAAGGSAGSETPKVAEIFRSGAFSAASSSPSKAEPQQHHHHYTHSLSRACCSPSLSLSLALPLSLPLALALLATTSVQAAAGH